MFKNSKARILVCHCQIKTIHKFKRRKIQKLIKAVHSNRTDINGSPLLQGLDLSREKEKHDFVLKCSKAALLFMQFWTVSRKGHAHTGSRKMRIVAKWFDGKKKKNLKMTVLELSQQEPDLCKKKF